MDKYNTLNATNNTFSFNLKGFIVGNGVTNWKYDADSALTKTGFYFGVQSRIKQQEMIDNNCTYQNEDINPNDSEVCKTLLK